MRNMKKIIKGVYAFILIFALFCLAGCSKQYSVIFDNNNETTVDIVTVSDGSTVSEPTQPYKEDCEFIGWYLDGELYDFSNKVTKDITLVARFQVDEGLAEKYTVSFYSEEKLYRSIKVIQDRTIDKFDGPSVDGGTFKYWTLDGEVFSFNTQITKDLTIYAKYEYETFHVTFSANGERNTVDVEYGNKVTKPEDPVLHGKKFYYWQNAGVEFDFDTEIKKDYELKAVFGRKDEDIINVEYDLGYDCFKTKEELRVAYYTDFYNFLISQNYDNWETYEISNLDDFLVFMDTFKWKSRNEMGTIGNAFGSYYVKKDVGGVLENQPETVFLGWCYKNNKYIDFIHHLEVFFEYWRTDEGYSQNDPNGNDFYAEPWASMVDTAKFFYFNGDTLQTKFNGIYKWFDSERVHDALDNIPGIGYVYLQTQEKFENSIVLPTDLTRKGYVFAGWVDPDGNKITEVTKSMKVTATWTAEQPE